MRKHRKDILDDYRELFNLPESTSRKAALFHFILWLLLLFILGLLIGIQFF